MSDAASTCVDCGYVKTRFKSPPCPVYHSGLHRWSALEKRAPGDRIGSAATRDDVGGLVTYEGEFFLCWLWPGERVGSAGDGTGAAIIYRADGREDRIEVGTLLEVAAEYEGDLV